MGTREAPNTTDSPVRYMQKPLLRGILGNRHSATDQGHREARPLAARQRMAKARVLMYTSDRRREELVLWDRCGRSSLIKDKLAERRPVLDAHCVPQTEPEYQNP